jgi:hypothetical protein
VGELALENQYVILTKQFEIIKIIINKIKWILVYPPGNLSPL